MTLFVPAGDGRGVKSSGLEGTGHLAAPTQYSSFVLANVSFALVCCAAVQIRDGLFHGAKKGEAYDPPVVLGFDASGVIDAVGSEVKRFNVGDHVMYSGNPNRPGSFQQYQLVDERIVGKKPAKITFEEAAALPLTSLTAWEAMHEVSRLFSTLA